LIWGGVHIAFLIGFRNRVQVLISWLWNWMLNARDARLITGDTQLSVDITASAEFAGSRCKIEKTDSLKPTGTN
jgi:hypothetical protein